MVQFDSKAVNNYLDLLTKYKQNWKWNKIVDGFTGVCVCVWCGYNIFGMHIKLCGYATCTRWKVITDDLNRIWLYSFLPGDGRKRKMVSAVCGWSVIVQLGAWIDFGAARCGILLLRAFFGGQYRWVNGIRQSASMEIEAVSIMCNVCMCEWVSEWLSDWVNINSVDNGDCVYDSLVHWLSFVQCDLCQKTNIHKLFDENRMGDETTTKTTNWTTKFNYLPRHNTQQHT